MRNIMRQLISLILGGGNTSFARRRRPSQDATAAEGLLGRCEYLQRRQELDHELHMRLARWLALLLPQDL